MARAFLPTHIPRRKRRQALANQEIDGRKRGRAEKIRLSSWATLSNVEKITSAILLLARNILYTPLPFRLFSNLSSVTMPALLLRISSKIAQKCRCKIAELILSTLLTSVLLSLFSANRHHNVCKNTDKFSSREITSPVLHFLLPLLSAIFDEPGIFSNK